MKRAVGAWASRRQSLSNHVRRTASFAPAGADPACASVLLALTYRAGFALALLCIACGSSLPEPRPARQPRSEYLPVPYPPPAGFSEVVPPAPYANAVWVDGHWAWRGRTYVWQRGGWLQPPDGARFAPWHARYTQDGTLMFADEIWYDAHLQPITRPKVLVPAYTPPNELTPESQHGF